MESFRVSGILARKLARESCCTRTNLCLGCWDTLLSLLSSWELGESCPCHHETTLDYFLNQFWQKASVCYQHHYVPETTTLYQLLKKISTIPAKIRTEVWHYRVSCRLEHAGVFFSYVVWKLIMIMEEKVNSIMPSDTKTEFCLVFKKSEPNKYGMLKLNQCCLQKSMFVFPGRVGLFQN